MLTLEQARQYARYEVDRMGADFVYNPAGKFNTCLYVRFADYPGELERAPAALGAHHTGCIVGSIISRAGLMNDTIARSTKSVDTLIAQRMLRVDSDRTQLYLIDLQNAQDRGRSWGDAFTVAEENLNADA
jgi:hypothetical protein